MATNKPLVYKITITPLISDNVYGTPVVVSDRIEINGLPKLRQQIDAGDYDIGIYNYGDISLKCDNKNGFFNTLEDERSMFTYVRNRAKVQIDFVEIDRADDGTEIPTVRYNGLINEEATRQNPQKDEIKFKVLSLDSVIRNTKISSGAIAAGQTMKQAMLTILTNSRITSVLTVSDANINPDLNILIDDGSFFSNLPSRDGLNALLRDSNSAMFIDSSQNVIIKSRDEDTTRPILNLFGKHDEQRRENIINVNNYNTGLHRLFTSVIVNGQEKSDSGLSEEIGTRQKKITNTYITDATKSAQIAQRLLTEFKAQKIELEVTVPTKLVKDNELLDRVSINYPLRVRPIKDKFLPVIGVTKIGDSDFPLPNVFGNIIIHPNTAFKIIQIDENPKKFETKLKLRQRGKTFSDGLFSEAGLSVVGFAVIGEDIIEVGDNPEEQFNPSSIGAAQIGLTEVA